MLNARIVPITNTIETDLRRIFEDSKAVGTIPTVMPLGNGSLLVVFDTLTRFQSGQNASVTTTASQLSTTNSTLPARALVVQADPANGANLLIGGGDGQYITLTAGSWITFDDVADLTQIYVKSASGTVTANWLVRA